MQKITPYLWFDREAREAAEFYTGAFGGDSALTCVTPIRNTPSGDVDVVSFRLLGLEFMAISGGPIFRFNPSVSFIINFDPSRRTDARDALDALWQQLADGGEILMPLGSYPFSKRYGWIRDRFGVSWQLILSNPEGEMRPAIMPTLLFTQAACGKAEEAMRFYVSLFANSREGHRIVRYGPGQEPEKPGTVMFEDFMLHGQWFAAMDSARNHGFSFHDGAISLLVHCEDQSEIDHFWNGLAADPEAGRCGWIKDPYGLSWQIVPVQLDALLRGPPERRDRVTQAFLKMKKFDLAALMRAAESE
ncbi:MAG: VOC family protein [Magnetococcales bacterium]|nr:VOC family protein [Magnetococcales bacterium]